jgi:chromosome segregation ATPase
MRSARSKKWSDSIRLAFFIAACFAVVVEPTFAQVGGKAVEQEQGQAKKQEQEKHILYEWTDSKGGVHITDQPGTIPERYRSTVHQVEAPPGEKTESIEQRSAPDSGISDNAENEADLKETWQQRMRRAKRHLSDLEQQYQELDQKRNEALGRWGGVASGRLEDREEAERIGLEMKHLQQEISDARNQIEVVIPDEARKAGIPPGWLRE